MNALRSFCYFFLRYNYVKYVMCSRNYSSVVLSVFSFQPWMVLKLLAWGQRIFWNLFRQIGLPCSSEGKESARNARDLSLIPRSGRSPGNGLAIHSSIFTWRIPWTKKCGGVATSPTLSNWATEWLTLFFHLFLFLEANYFTIL